MIIVIKNKLTGEITVLPNIRHDDDLELESYEEIIATKHETHDSLINDDCYGSRPGENGIQDYYDRTDYSERQSDLYENFHNQD